VAAGVGVAVLLGSTAGLLLAPVIGAVVWRWLGTLESRESRRRRAALSQALPLTVDLLAACLAVGASPGAALGQVAAAVEPPMREELAAVAARLRLGADPGTVWDELAHHAELGPLGRSLARAVRTGSSVADAMSRLAEDLRTAGRTEVEGRARAVGVKAAAPLGLCLLPAFVLIGVVPLVAGSVSRLLSP
jgi:Flp pilus assembly protein TadB